MQSSAQEVTMLFKLIAAAKDSWACFPLFPKYAYNHQFSVRPTAKDLIFSNFFQVIHLPPPPDKKNPGFDPVLQRKKYRQTNRHS